MDRQREHQANERTFLAWLRTSTALISFGFVIARFGIFLRQLQPSLTNQPLSNESIFSSETLGVSLVIFGVLTIALAAYRHNQVFWQIERGNYRPTRLTVWIMTAIVMILGILSVPLLVWRSQPELPKKSILPQSQHWV
jgi:putative membrane protein